MELNSWPRILPDPQPNVVRCRPAQSEGSLLIPVSALLGSARSQANRPVEPHPLAGWFDAVGSGERTAVCLVDGRRPPMDFVLAQATVRGETRILVPPLIDVGQILGPGE